MQVVLVLASKRLTDDRLDSRERHYHPQKHPVEDIDFRELDHLLRVVDIV